MSSSAKGFQPEQKHNPKRQRRRVYGLTKTWLPSLHYLMQFYFTWLTGVPYGGKLLLLPSNSFTELAFGVADLAIGTIGSYVALTAGPAFWVFIPFFWLFTVGGARHLVVEIAHWLTHGTMFKELDTLIGQAHREQLNSILGRAITIFLLAQDFPSYKLEHVGLEDVRAKGQKPKPNHHNGSDLATLSDADWCFINSLGFRPDQPEQNWHLLRKLWVSPKFHLRFLASRLEANLFTAPLGYRLIAWCWLLLVLGVVTLTQTYLVFTVCWILPLVVGYQAAALTQLVSLHNWGYETKATDPLRVMFESKTSNRSLDVIPPDVIFADDPLAWSGYWVGLFTVKFALRKTVFVGSLVVHAEHHLHPAAPLGMQQFLLAAKSRQAGQLGVEIVGGLRDFLNHAWNS
jgi:hypothetical protein